MITFKQYLEEGRFRESPKLIHKLDVPMFSIFLDSWDADNSDETTWGDVSEAFKIAKKKINKMGFPSMHTNVVFKDYGPKELTTLGKAHGNPESSPKHKKLKSISLSKKLLHGLENNYSVIMNKLILTIVHEWAHVWMFNNGKEFRNAVKQYHEALTQSNIDKIPYKYEDPDRIFQTFYNRLYSQTQNTYTKKQNIKLVNIQNNVENILLDVLNDFGMYALAIDSEIIKKYANTIGKIVYNNLTIPNEIPKQIEALNLEKVFGDIVKNETQRRIMKRDDVRKQLSDLVNFTGAYGLKDPDETWATALEKFNALHPYHRQRIFELMQVRGPREIPNSRMQKHLQGSK